LIGAVGLFGLEIGQFEITFKADRARSVRRRRLPVCRITVA
jgi:hypothetical protein